jgi:hypothetical protein
MLMDDVVVVKAVMVFSAGAIERSTILPGPLFTCGTKVHSITVRLTPDAEPLQIEINGVRTNKKSIKSGRILGIVEMAFAAFSWPVMPTI